MAPEFNERRRCERIQLTFPVSGQCLTKGSGSHPFKGETSDVSFKGFCVKVDHTNGFKAGQDVKFRTRLYQGDFLIKARGRVCWIHELPNSEKPIMMGILLTHMRHYSLWRERIEDKICQLS